MVSQLLQVCVNRLPGQGKFFSKYEKPVVLRYKSCLALSTSIDSVGSFLMVSGRRLLCQ